MYRRLIFQHELSREAQLVQKGSLRSYAELPPIDDPEKVEGCATALRSDKRPWCSLDKIFTGNFIFCDEDEAIKLKRVNELKAEELYNTAANGLMENLKPEKYDLYKVMLDQEFIQLFLWVGKF